MHNGEARIAVVKPKPTLVQIGKRKISTIGFRHDLLEEHLLLHQGWLSKQWCDLVCGAQTFFQKATKENQRQFGIRVYRAWNEMYRRGHFLVIEFAPMGGRTHGEVLACKFYVAGESGAEQQAAAIQLERMKKRRQVSEEKFQGARRLLGLCEATPHSESPARKGD